MQGLQIIAYSWQTARYGADSRRTAYPSPPTTTARLLVAVTRHGSKVRKVSKI